jgi:RNA polymerase sigma factor (sigma-70 family)
VKFDALFEQQYPRIRNYLRRKLGHNGDHADDIAQVIFKKYLDRFEKAPEPKNPAAWLMRVAHNDYKQFFRNKNSCEEISECDWAQVFKNSTIYAKPSEHLTPTEIERQQSEPWIQHLDTLAELAEDARASIVLFYPSVLGRHFEHRLKRLFKPRMAKRILKANTEWPGGASTKDIAQLLRLPQGTVRSHLSRVRAKLEPLFMKRILEEKARRGSAIKYPKEFRVRPFASSLGRKPSFTDGSDHARQFFELMPPREPHEARSTQPTHVTAAPDRKPPRRCEREKRSDSYQCGSAFKGCQHCGAVRYWGKCKCGNTVQRRENDPVRCERPGRNDPTHPCGGEIKPTRKIYDSGFDVWRSYSPRTTGWTYWCGTCGAKDEQCWENCAAELGLEPRLRPSESRTTPSRRRVPG